ncbi:zinc-ribbon domain-containing protein [Bifidobacterium criceti]|uniref:Transmembrane serine/threonine-protein kinase B n=1 Tax=Bifidobacterium criceti TaxID=1960969 RepID=A0A2A2ED84_9BIFI|nr:zinc ribbon domain-containing protein [Bifidobacterium criceti]PAU66991.1 transmembrane serine/threonine- protein kinase B [Bifidobacterium criceti]
MKFCSQCGKPLGADAKVCGYCGTPVHGVPVARPSAPVAAPTTQTPVDAVSATSKSTKVLRAAIAAVVAVILVFGGLLVYNTWFAGAEVPSAGAQDRPKADDVVARLKGEGIDATKRQRYAKEPAGQYLGVDGVPAGGRVKKGTSAVVVESLGPGVPEGTVGKERGDAVEQVKDMGVPVTTYGMVSNNPGAIVASYPEDGHALTEDGERMKGDDLVMPKAAEGQADGILLAVGVEGRGVPAETYGMNGDKATDMLEKDGFAVTTQLVPADKDMIGKVVRTDPAIGHESDETDVTVYVGADAKDLREAMMTTAYDQEGYHGRVVADFTPLLGTWCRDDGSCVTLAQQKDDVSGDGAVRNITVTRDGKTQPDRVSNSGLKSHPGDTMAATDWDLDNPFGGLENLLSAGDTGVIDIYDGNPLPYCGTEPVALMASRKCVNGTLVDSGSSDGGFEGTTFPMNEFLLIAPVGADMDAVKRSGYFAKDNELKRTKGAQQGKADAGVDENRPYLLLRDPNLYDKDDIEVGYDIRDLEQSPFIPTEHGGPDVKFAPAPSASSAYYFVNDGFNWATFDNGVQVCDADGCTAHDDADKAQQADAKKTTPDAAKRKTDATKRPSPQSSPTQMKKRTAEDMTASEIRDTLNSGDFSIIAGRYCSHDDGCLIVDDEGDVRAEGASRKLTREGSGTTLHVNEEQMFADPAFEQELVPLGAPDDDYRCVGVDGDVELTGTSCLNSSGYSAADTFFPAQMLYYPKGIDLNGEGVTGRYATIYASYTSPDTSRPFIQWLQRIENPPVADEIVYYLVD